jgi:hypothetical protein
MGYALELMPTVVVTFNLVKTDDYHNQLQIFTTSYWVVCLSNSRQIFRDYLCTHHYNRATTLKYFGKI